MTKVLGCFLISVPFLFIAMAVTHDFGLMMALLIFAIVGLMIGCVVGGMYLILR